MAAIADFDIGNHLSNGKAIRGFYSQNISEVNELMAGLYRRVRVANSIPVIHEILPHDKFLDRLSLLFMGNEKCAAIGFSGDNLLISTNVSEHKLASMKYKLKYNMIHKKKEDAGSKYYIVARCTLFFKDGSSLSQDSKLVEYNYLHDKDELRIVNMDPNLIFHFPKEQLPDYFDKDINISLTLVTGQSPVVALAFSQMEKGASLEWDKPVYLPVNQLEERIIDVINNLSLYAQFYQKFRKFNDETNSPKFQRYIKLINEALLEMQFPDIVDPVIFTQTFLIRHKDELHFSSLKQFCITKSIIASLFDDIRRLKRINSYLNKDMRWPVILSESLTLLLSNLPMYTKVLGLDTNGKLNREELSNLYQRMVENYQEFKSVNNCRTSEKSVTKWFDTLKERREDDLLKFPLFVKERYEVFLENAKRHFIALAYLQDFVINDAFKNGALSRILSKESVFKKSKLIRIIDGVNEEHAEMTLFDHHLSSGIPSGDYFGISKLCCALCNYTLNQFSAAGLRVPRRRGYHTEILDKWALMRSLDDENNMKVFLGDDLFSTYSKLKGKVFEFSKGTQYDLTEIAKHLIYRLATINNDQTMNVLKIEGPLMRSHNTLFA